MENQYKFKQVSNNVFESTKSTTMIDSAIVGAIKTPYNGASELIGSGRKNSTHSQTKDLSRKSLHTHFHALFRNPIQHNISPHSTAIFMNQLPKY